MVNNWIPLREFVKQNGMSEGTLRNYIFNAKATGIVESGALIRVMGRWYVDPVAFERWAREHTAKWLESQPEPVR